MKPDFILWFLLKLSLRGKQGLDFYRLQNCKETITTIRSDLPPHTGWKISDSPEGIWSGSCSSGVCCGWWVLLNTLKLWVGGRRGLLIVGFAGFLCLGGIRHRGLGQICCWSFVVMVGNARINPGDLGAPRRHESCPHTKAWI